MAKVEIYTTPFCPYCRRAKALLEDRRVPFTEFDVTETPGKRAEMRARSGGRNTVPQIFINDRPIGGSDELFDLDRTGALNGLLGRAG